MGRPAMTFRKQISKRWLAGSLAIALSACLGAPASMAEGVVVKSVIADYPVGSVVAEGEELRLAKGQSLTVLDRSGAIVVQGPGKYAAPAKRSAAGVIETAAALAAGPQAKATIGGVRCVPGPDQKCRDPHPDVLLLRVTDYVPAKKGKPMQLVLDSNFDGLAVCVGWNTEDDAHFLAGADPKHPLKLSVAHTTRLTSAPVKSGKKGGKPAPSWRSVDCAGVYTDTWKAMGASAVQALSPNTAPIVLSAFARMHGETAVEARASARPS